MSLLWLLLLLHLTLNSTVNSVNVPAHLIQKYALIAVKRGDNSVLSCEAFGSPPIAVHWIRRVDDSSPSNPSSISSPSSSSSSSSPLNKSTGKLITLPVTSLGTRYLETEFSSKERNLLPKRFTSFQFDSAGTFDGEVRTQFELYISNSELTDSGVYYCNVSNEFGDDSKTIDLTILDVPSAPEDIMIDGTWSRGVSLKWRPSRSDGNSLITEYIIQYWQFVSTHGNNNITKSGSSKDATASSLPCSSSSSIKRMFEEEVSSSVTSHVLRGTLIPGSSYCLRMMGKNQYGRGDTSNVISFTTKSEAPSESPIELSAEAIGSTVLVIKWKPPPKDRWNGQLTAYKIGYRVVPNGQLTSPSTAAPFGSSNSISNSSNTFAFTSSSSSSSSSSSEEESAEVEAAITSIKSTRGSGFIARAREDSAVVSLPPNRALDAEGAGGAKSPDHLPVDLDQFILKQVPFSAIPSEEQQLILTGLSKATTYQLIVQAVNDAGPGPFSQPIHVSTSSNDLPEPPVLWVTEVTETSIKLKWDQRRNPSDLTHYILYYKDERSPWMEIAFPVPEDKKYELLNLQPQSWYQLYMRAVSTSGGTSDPSEVLTITTQAKRQQQKQQQFKGHIPSLAKQSKNDPAGTITSTIGNSGHSHHTSHQGYHTSNGGHSLQISAAMAAAAASGSNSPYHSRSTEYPYPSSLYTSSILILIVTVAIVIVIIACSFAYVYVKLEERKVASNNCFLSSGHGYTAIGSPTSTPGNNFKWIAGHSSSQLNQSISSGSSPGTVSSSCASTPGGYKGPPDENKGSPSSSPANLPCPRNLLNPRPPVPTFLWASQGPISEEDSDDLASNSYATLPFDRLLLHKDQGGEKQEQMATQAIPLESSSTSSPSKGGSICVSAQVHPHQNKSAGQTMEIFVNNMYDIPCHLGQELGANYSVSQAVTAINDQVTNRRPKMEEGAKSAPFKGSTASGILALGSGDDSHGTYSSNQLHEASANELSWQNNLPEQTCEFISTSTSTSNTKSHGSDSCQDDLSHCARRLKSERISQVTMNANCSSNFSDISSHGISHKSFIHRQRELNECDINSSSGTCASGSLASFNSPSSLCPAADFVSATSSLSASPPAAGEPESRARRSNGKLRPHSYCFANSTSALSPSSTCTSTCDADTSNLLYHQNHNQGNQKEQGDQLSSRDQRALTRKSCVISAV